MFAPVADFLSMNAERENAAAVFACAASSKTTDTKKTKTTKTV